jgi:hypothetical protein
MQLDTSVAVGRSHQRAGSFRLDAVVSGEAYEAPALDERQSSRWTLTSRLLCAADASVKRPWDLRLDLVRSRRTAGLMLGRSLAAPTATPRAAVANVSIPGPDTRLALLRQ